MRLVAGAVAQGLATPFEAKFTDVLVTFHGDACVSFAGETPVAGSVGHEFKAGTTITWSRSLVNTAKFIRVGGSDSAIHLTPLC